MKISLVAALIFSVLNIAQAAELCSKDSEGNWKTTKGAPCYMGQQRPGQPANQVVPTQERVAASVSSGIVSPSTTTGLRRYVLQPNDKTVEGAFVRWAAESKLGKQVVWRATRKPPLDAYGEIEADNPVAAMTMVAASFESSRYPFVIEEYDNVIVVTPKVIARLNAD